ncbi:hypothetical protein [Rhodococcoides corynebacterioides]|uniref:Uncharacterized protein n=1 Tax=Rhodococcoides corynebacterioides TaxID=53972 RepID=A0ABS7P3V5_9NOCA|nr:hypothetical protein [Rhodococcus corynebacterioides]MBY6367092.1 hypothetical protein [Rhodococcus corynebacterioides]MBY6407353.1 hypothetical protein [Rhodococcus corynebacterioides]
MHHASIGTPADARSTNSKRCSNFFETKKTPDAGQGVEGNQIPCKEYL